MSTYRARMTASEMIEAGGEAIRHFATELALANERIAMLEGKHMMLAYPVHLEEISNGPPEDHCVLVTFPDIPEANTFGKDRDDALESAIDCLDVALGGRIRYCDDIPAWKVRSVDDIPMPSAPNGHPTVSPSITTAAKVMLYLELCRQNVSNADLARRMGSSTQEVGRMLNPSAQTKIGMLERAFEALGKRLVVGVE